MDRSKIFRFGSFLVIFMAGVTTSMFAQGVGPLEIRAEPKLKANDFLYTDSGDGPQGSFILSYNPETGQETVISKGGYLGSFGCPNGVVVDRTGQVIVANGGCILRIDPNTGAQTLMRDNRSAPGAFWSVALDYNGDPLVAAESAVLRLDSVTGEMRVLSSGGFFNTILSLAAGKGGDLFVTNIKYDSARGGFISEIIRVNRQNGRQTLISRGGYLTILRGIAVDGDNIYVTGMATSDQNFGKGRVTHVHAGTGIQTVISEEENLVCPMGIAVDGNGQLIVADPYTINPNSVDLFDGGIIRIDPATGLQTLLKRGHDSVVNPCGLAIVPANRGLRVTTR